MAAQLKEAAVIPQPAMSFTEVKEQLIKEFPFLQNAKGRVKG